MFQREWYRLSGEGKLSDVDMGTVPDIYIRNQQLGALLMNHQEQQYVSGFHSVDRMSHTGHEV